MLPRRYRRSYYPQNAELRKEPRLLARVIFACLALALLWIIGSKVIHLFRDTYRQSTGALLTVETAAIDGVAVALQGAQPQAAENNLKMYAGDRVITHNNSTATLTFFDGTRLRLDQGSELIIRASDERTDTSVLSVDLVQGKAWIATPDFTVFSGAITRTVSTHNMVVNAPADTQALLSSNYQLAVLRAAGIGTNITITTGKGTDRTMVIGEGQYVNLSKSDDLNAVIAGTDPYKYRDVIPANILRDPFVVKSYSLLALADLQSGSETTTATGQNPDLTVTSPTNGSTVTIPLVRVSGRVSQRIQTVMVNNFTASPQSDGTFTTELNLPVSSPSQTIHLEAKDAQGIVLAQQDVHITIAGSEAVSSGRGTVKPVRITAPGGNDETVTVTTAEVDITGEAPLGAQGIMVNDYKLQLFKPGSKTWSYLANANLGNMNIGKNVYTVYALDKDGNKSAPVSITIDYVPTGQSSVSSPSSSTPLRQNPPISPSTLHVTKPATGTSATVTDKEIVIEGTTSADTASISINGYQLQLYQAGKTTWNYIASQDLSTMKDGKNIYRIVSRNAKGEILDILEYTITKQ